MPNEKPPAKRRRKPTAAQERARAITEARSAYRAIERAEREARKTLKRTLRRGDVSLRELSAALDVPRATLHRFVHREEVKP